MWLFPSERIPESWNGCWYNFFFPTDLLVISPLLWLQSSADLFAVRERINESQLNHPTFPAARQPSTSVSPGVQWADLAAIQSQLQIQSQVRHYSLFPKARCASPSIWCPSCGYNTSKHSFFRSPWFFFFNLFFFSLLFLLLDNWVAHTETPWCGEGAAVPEMSNPDPAR